MTSRNSRFDKLEEAKPVTASSTESGLTRFEEDGATSLKLDFDPLAELPMLQCPECQLESSKWDKTCIHCGASLTSLQAIAHNRQLVEARRLTKDTELEAAKQQRDASMAAHVNEKAALILGQAKAARDADIATARIVGSTVAVTALVLTLTVDSYALKALCFVGFVSALVCVLRR